MRLLSILSLAVVITGFAVPVSADTYESVTTSSGSSMPLTETKEVRTVESAPAVIREQPVVVTPPANNNTVIVKKHHGHLIQLGPAKLF